MSVISTLIEPHRVTRVFFDCRAVEPNSADLQHIEQSIERSIVRAEADDDARVTLTMVRNGPPKGPRSGV